LADTIEVDRRSNFEIIFVAAYGCFQFVVAEAKRGPVPRFLGKSPSKTLSLQKAWNNLTETSKEVSFSGDEHPFL
jgi:hypothetical protein